MSPLADGCKSAGRPHSNFRAPPTAAQLDRRGCLENPELSPARSVLVAAAGLWPGPAQARDQIRIVGSSTVYPFTTAVAEQLGETGGVKTPVVESTGTGGGMKLFCAGVGEEHPMQPMRRAA